METVVNKIVQIFIAVIMLGVLSQIIGTLETDPTTAKIIATYGGWGWALVKFVSFIMIPLTIFTTDDPDQLLKVSVTTLVVAIMYISLYMLVGAAEASGMLSYVENNYSWVWAITKFIVMIIGPLYLLKALAQKQFFIPLPTRGQPPQVYGGPM